MSKVEEIERIIAQLPTEDFEKLAEWMTHRWREQGTPDALRAHSAFLNGYAPEDENLYDDAAAR